MAFTCEDARVKLLKLYPSINECHDTRPRGYERAKHPIISNRSAKAKQEEI